MPLCEYCSNEILTVRQNSKFCSKECRNKKLLEKYHAEKHLKKEKKHISDINCLNCQQLMKSVLPHKKYCCKGCQRKYLNKQLGFEKYDDENLNNNVRGAMNEMIVCADLIRKGFEVFKALTNNSCDMAILMKKVLYRVEVTTGNIYCKNGRVHMPMKDKNKHDILAVVLKNGSIVYTPTIESIKCQI